MTGTSILTQNVTTFIKNSANFEKYFLPGVVAFEDFRKASSYHFGCQNFLGLLLQQETCQDAQQRNDDADRPAQVPHAAGTEDYANKQGSKRHSHISCPAGKTCDDRQTFLVEDLRQDGIKCPQSPGSAKGKDKCSRIKQTEVCKIQKDQHQGSDDDQDRPDRHDQDAGAPFMGHSASHHIRDLTGNQACLVCTNGTGFFGSHHLYGHSQIISPEGHCIWEAGETPTICTMTLDLVARCRKYGTNFQDHYLRHLFEYNFPMPYADDFKKAPLYKEIGEGPRNVAEYDENIKDVMENPIGKRAPENMDVDTWQKNLDDFLASRK